MPCRVKPSRISLEEEGAYEIEEIRGTKLISDKPHYLVKWEGYGEEECTWEPEENFNPETLEEFRSRMN